MSFALDTLQRKQIERRRHQTRDYRLAMRLSTLLWRDDGRTQTEIAHLLGICTRRGQRGGGGQVTYYFAIRVDA